MDKTTLGNRMKGYEYTSRHKLVRRMPVIIRIDGKAFHTLTEKMDKPYDEDFKNLMMNTARYLVSNVMNCKLAYVQSDEISLLLVDYAKLETQAFFGNVQSKIESVTASMATAIFNHNFNSDIMFDPNKRAEIKQSFGMFDSRAWNIPHDEVCNYFIWRQQDATRNSIQGLGQANLTKSQMKGINNHKVQELLITEKGINWNDISTYFKRGGCVYRGDDGVEIVDWDIPIFSKPEHRDFINRFVFLDGE